MKRILLLTTPSKPGAAPPAALPVAESAVERIPLPAADAPPATWDALVAALLAADVVITD
jgi:hypothetical protein